MFRGKSIRLADMVRKELKAEPSEMKAVRQALPEFRFVDFYSAAAEIAGAQGDAKLHELAHYAGLEQQLIPVVNDQSTLTPAARKEWMTGPDKKAFFPEDCFWFVKSPKSALVIRMRHFPHSADAELSVAAMNANHAQAVLEMIAKTANAQTIYRNHPVSLGYESGTRDQYGDVEKPERLTVSFQAMQQGAAEDTVLSERHLGLLQRNIIDFDARRDVIKAAGIPARRGVLLHGPPGTGKTQACRYVCQRMPNTTHIFLTGSALGNVSAVFSLARMLQPSVIYVEDADLMFSSREINLYSSSLGELMDQLDGLPVNDEISLVMTTNAIDRIEAALKDRPGRISQSIYMGAPGPDLRERFLDRLLAPYDVAETDMGHLVSTSEGATQAFLKEWVYRAVQMATEDDGPDGSKVALQTRHFVEAMAEMQSDREDAAGTIVGFRSGMP